MKLSIPIVLLVGSCPGFAADCDWTDPHPIPNENKIDFQECKALKRIRIDKVEVQPNIEFEIVHADYPEGNTIWSVHSPDEKTVVVFIENRQYQRNAWVIDRASNEVLLFIDRADGRHFKVTFDGNERFRIIHAGMGYRTDYIYEREAGAWSKTGHEQLATDVASEVTAP